MNRKLIFFINPISGTRAKAKVPEIIQQLTSAQGLPFGILHTNAAGDYAYLIDKINSENITDVIICGGDGTVNQLANALLGVDVNIGIVPMGSGNGLAFAAGIPKQIEKALAVVYKGRAMNVDSFYINGRFSCMLCGLGFDAQVAHDFAKQNKRGLATYVKQSTRNFFRAKAYPFTLEVNGKQVSSDAYFISIANSNQFGNNFTIAPKASLHDGLLDIVVVNKMNKMRLVWSILRQIRMGKVKPYGDQQRYRNSIHYFQTDHLSIGNPQGAPLHIDGDPADTSSSFEIKIIKNAFRLLMP